MYRDITKNLIKWKDSPRRKPLLVTGVRQCGKTYIIEEFAKDNFENYVYLNFERSEQFSSIFDYDLDVKRILKEIELNLKCKIIPGKTLIFFDEIQACPRAITSLKYFCEEMRALHIVCAGSLLGVALKRSNISFPVGKYNSMKLYPMSFKEFVIANGRNDLVDLLSEWPVDRKIPELYSKPMEDLLKEFYIVGGMPEAVKTWVETKDHEEVMSVQEEILEGYANDFSKHAPVQEIPKIRWIWDSVPVQLAKENNKFIFSHVKEGKRAAELEDSLQWLVDAGLIYQLFMNPSPEFPISGGVETTFFKVYMSDIGLLRARAKLSPETILDGGSHYITFKGAFAENYVHNEMKVLGKDTYFWRSGNKAEVDLMFEEKDKLIPVEIKSADNTQAKSYKLFCEKYEPEIGFKISAKNIASNKCINTTTYNIPLYLSWNIDKYL